MWSGLRCSEDLNPDEKQRIEVLFESKLKRSIQLANGNTKEPKNLVVPQGENLFVWDPEQLSLYYLILKDDSSIINIQVSCF